MIKRIFFTCWLLLVAGSSWAAAPVTAYYLTGYTWFDGSARYTTAQALCEAFAAARNVQDTTSTSVCSARTQGPSQIFLDRTTKKDGSVSLGLAYDIKGGAWCPTTNTAPNTTKPLAQQCDDPPPPSCPKGQSTTEWFPKSGSGSGFPVCAESGCAVEVTDVGMCIGISTGTWCEMKGSTTGATCNSQASNKDTTAYGAAQGANPGSAGASRVDVPTTKGAKNVPCPTGTVQGGIDADGTPLCIGSGSAPKNPSAVPPTTTSPPVTITNPDGSTTTTQTTTQQNADGSTTTVITKTVVAADGTKSVSQSSDTSKTPSGGSGKQDTPNTDQANLCKQNPQLAICQNSNVSGDCSAGAAALTCTGDAVQCAQLRYSAELACKRRQDDLDVKALPSTAVGDSILGGTDGKKGEIDALMKGTEVDMSKPQLDQAGFIAGGSCIPNKTISVMGKPVEINFTQVCSNIQPLRAGVMACAFILAYLIVARSVLQS